MDSPHTLSQIAAHYPLSVSSVVGVTHEIRSLLPILGKLIEHFAPHNLTALSAQSQPPGISPPIPRSKAFRKPGQHPWSRKTRNMSASAQDYEQSSDPEYDSGDENDDFTKRKVVKLVFTTAYAPDWDAKDAFREFYQNWCAPLRPH